MMQLQKDGSLVFQCDICTEEKNWIQKKDDWERCPVPDSGEQSGRVAHVCGTCVSRLCDCE